MEDDWQIDAVQNQFQVFEELDAPCREVAAEELKNDIAVVVSKHKHGNVGYCGDSDSSKSVSNKILNKNQNKQLISYSYAVIVTSKKENNMLCRVPVFAVMVDDRKIFIDLNCTEFTSWKMFLKANNLPPCQFCFPVNGYYNVGGKLNIDIATSPAGAKNVLSQVVPSQSWVPGILITCGDVVSTFFLKIQRIPLKCAEFLAPIASGFVTAITDFPGQLCDLVSLIRDFTVEKSMSIANFTLSSCNMLLEFATAVFKYISTAFLSVISALRKCYDSVRNILSDTFTLASKASQFKFLGVTSKIDTSMSNIETEVDEILRESLTRPNKLQTTEIQKSLLSQENNVKGILENSKGIALNNQCKGKNNEELNPKTEDLLTISNNIAKVLQRTSLNEVQDIFESLSDMVKEDYKNLIKKYGETVKATKAVAGDTIDLSILNENLGIKGDPKVHYWFEAMKCCKNIRQSLLITEKIKELQKDKKLILNSIWSDSNDDNVNHQLYWSVGVNGAGKFSATEVLDALQEKSINIDRNNLFINETTTLTTIRTKEWTVLVQQDVNDEKTSEGVVFISRADEE